jgi:antiviral helicase SKI2
VSKVSSGLTSTSLDRAPAPRTNFVRGKSSYVAYKPGGLDDVLNGSQSNRPLHETSPLPPGLSRRMRFSDEELPEDLIQSDLEEPGEPKSEVRDTQLEVLVAIV